MSSEATVSDLGAAFVLGARTVHLHLDMGAFSRLQRLAGTLDLRKLEHWLLGQIRPRTTANGEDEPGFELDVDTLLDIVLCLAHREQPPIRRAELEELSPIFLGQILVAVSMATAEGLPSPAPAKEAAREEPDSPLPSRPSSRRPAEVSLSP